MRHDAENLSDAVFNKETRDHLVRAGTEIILAVDSMVPSKIPSDVKNTFWPPSVRRSYFSEHSWMLS